MECNPHRVHELFPGVLAEVWDLPGDQDDLKRNAVRILRSGVGSNIKHLTLYRCGYSAHLFPCECAAEFTSKLLAIKVVQLLSFRQLVLVCFWIVHPGCYLADGFGRIQPVIRQITYTLFKTWSDVELERDN